MSNRAQPNLTSDAVPSSPAPHVVWFGASRRLIAGQPDSHYGWMDKDDGPCIVKALDLELTAYSSTLLSHERAVLTRLRACHAPAPELLDLGRPDWLVTRFAGLSLQLLELRATDDPVDQPALRLPFDERLAAWVHLLQRAQSMADQGVLAIDIYASNLVLPMTGGTSGQLRLHEAVLIDHAHTVVAGLNMRRPIWLDRDM